MRYHFRFDVTHHINHLVYVKHNVSAQIGILSSLTFKIQVLDNNLYYSCNVSCAQCQQNNHHS